MGLENKKFNGIFASVLATGEISVKCEEDEVGAVKREYEDSQTKEMKIKWEKIYTELSGLITSIKFFEGDYGKLLQLTVDDNGSEVVLGFPTSSNFCEDLMKKLPNVDLGELVIIKPYAFTDKVSKKLKKGVTITQDGEKINSYFSNFIDGKSVATNGIPEPEVGKKYDTEDWKMYFMVVRKFLVNFITENIIPVLEEVASNKNVMLEGEEVKENNVVLAPAEEVKVSSQPPFGNGLDISDVKFD